MKFGTVVIYKEFGQEFPALVVGSRELEHHAGENGEPLLNLVFVREVKNGAGEVINVSGSSREADAVQFRHDIAHESHAFSEDAKAELIKKGLLPPGGEVPGGRYTEAVVARAEVVESALLSIPAGQAVDSVVIPAESLTGFGSANADATAPEPAAEQSAEASGDGDAQSAEPETVN